MDREGGMALVEEKLPGVSKGRLVIYAPLEAEKSAFVCAISSFVSLHLLLLLQACSVVLLRIEIQKRSRKYRVDDQRCVSNVNRERSPCTKHRNALHAVCYSNYQVNEAKRAAAFVWLALYQFMHACLLNLNYARLSYILCI